MGALRRDEALQRERFRRTAPKESSRASTVAVQRFCNVNIGTIGVEAHANVTGPRSPYDIAASPSYILQAPSRYDSCATDYHSLLTPIKSGARRARIHW